MVAAAVEQPAVSTGGGRPRAYKTRAGKKVPGVTTVKDRFKESGGLVHWAWQCGIDGIDYRKARDDAGAVGHYAHALVDADIHGRPLPEPPRDMTAEDANKACQAHAAFRSWRDQVKLDIINTETPGVCELYLFGGTWDAIARVNGELMLLDWKSSNAVYRDYICQVGAYRHLARKAGYPIDAAGLLRFGKTHGDFTYHYWPKSVIDLGWESFTRMLELYELDRKLKEIVR